MNQISLDINKSGQIINEPVVLRVGDKDQTITVNLLKDGQPYTSFTTATFFANKPSGAIVANDPANISSGTITYTVPQALVNEFGKITNAYFLIDGKTSTESFVIAVLQGVNISDDLNDYIPGMSNLNVIYDKWKDKLQAITDELNGVDAPKEVKNVIDNELKNYTDQINELQRRITAAETQLNALEVPKIGGVNLLKSTTADVQTVSNWNNQYYKGPIADLGLSVGNPIIYSAFLDNTNAAITKGLSYVMVIFYDAGDHELIRIDGNNINHGMVGTSSAFARIPDRAVTLGLLEITVNQEKNTAVGKRMLERGTLATDWTPAPEDYINQLSSTNNSPLTSNADWDGYVNSGVYLVQGASGGNNIPTGTRTTWGYLMVLNGSSSGGAVQIYYDCVDTPVELYMRGTRGTPLVWSSWIKLTTLDSLNGKTITGKDSAGKDISIKITGIS